MQAQMQADMQTLLLAGELESADLSDCCNDMPTWAKSGQLCKSGLDGQGLAAWAPATATPESTSAASSGPPAALKPPEPCAPSDAPWRPPSAS